MLLTLYHWACGQLVPQKTRHQNCTQKGGPATVIIETVSFITFDLHTLHRQNKPFTKEVTFSLRNVIHTTSGRLYLLKCCIKIDCGLKLQRNCLAYTSYDWELTLTASDICHTMRKKSYISGNKYIKQKYTHIRTHSMHEKNVSSHINYIFFLFCGWNFLHPFLSLHSMFNLPAFQIN